MDNVVFNVNGLSKNQLNMAIMTRMAQEYFNTSDVEFDIIKLDEIAIKHFKGCFVSKKHGLVLCWAEIKNLPEWTSLRFRSVKELTDFVWDWLQSEAARDIEMPDWDDDADHDGHNKLGWRAFVEDWGHVNKRWEAFLAIKPAYLWYGK